MLAVIFREIHQSEQFICCYSAEKKSNKHPPTLFLCSRRHAIVFFRMRPLENLKKKKAHYQVLPQSSSALWVAGCSEFRFSPFKCMYHHNG
jgi:hypothetical protein